MSQQRNNKSILFIDDEPDTLSRLKNIFEPHYDCFFADTGKSGLALFHKNKPPLVVCDVNLPDISGFDICRELKTSNPELCLVLLSAYNNKESRLEGLESLADTYIDKALSGEELFLRIRNLHPNNANPSYLDENVANASLTKQITAIFSQIYTSSKSTKKEANLPDVALKLALSPRSLQRKLKDETGLSYSQHHLNFRLNESKKRLKQGYSSTDISEMLGFSSPSHFSSSFKSLFSVTPSAYLYK